jgi:hypothetical protein
MSVKLITPPSFLFESVSEATPWLTRLQRAIAAVLLRGCWKEQPRQPQETVLRLRQARGDRAGRSNNLEMRGRSQLFVDAKAAMRCWRRMGSYGPQRCSMHPVYKVSTTNSRSAAPRAHGARRGMRPEVGLATYSIASQKVNLRRFVWHLSCKQLRILPIPLGHLHRYGNRRIINL